MSKEYENPWTTLEKSIVYENPWIEVTHEKVLNPAGNPGIYGKVHFKNLAIGIIPIDEAGYTWMVGQYRYPLDQYSWEIPEGGGPMDVSPLESAQRELEEECGLHANQWTELVRSHLSNSVTDELAIIFVATNLKEVQACPEETEQLLIRKMHLKEVFSMLDKGEITDSMSVIGLQKLQLGVLRGEMQIPGC